MVFRFTGPVRIRRIVIRSIRHNDITHCSHVIENASVPLTSVVYRQLASAVSNQSSAERIVYKRPRPILQYCSGQLSRSRGLSPFARIQTEVGLLGEDSGNSSR